MPDGRIIAIWHREKKKNEGENRPPQPFLTLTVNELLGNSLVIFDFAPRNVVRMDAGNIFCSLDFSHFDGINAVGKVELCLRIVEFIA